MIKSYEAFTYDIGVEKQDRKNFMIIFNAIYENHLTLNERMLIEGEYGIINENSYFGDLVDKTKRGVLKLVSDADKLLVDLAQKAKDVLDFGKQLANQIGNYIKGQFNQLLEKIKQKALKDAPFITAVIEFLDSKRTKWLKRWTEDIVKLTKYIVSGKFLTDMINRLSELFGKILNMGTNEGFYYLESEFLFEEEGDKQSFLDRLKEKINQYPPFSWIPKLEELLKKGIMYVYKIVDNFFAWVEGKTPLTEAINLKRAVPKYAPLPHQSTYTAGFYFLFQVLELYLYYLTIGKIEEFKKKIHAMVDPNAKKDENGEASGNPIKDFTDDIKDQAIEQMWKLVGIDGPGIIKAVVTKIPMVGDLLKAIDILVVAIGTYMAIKPTLDRALIPLAKNAINKITANEEEPNPEPTT